MLISNAYAQAAGGASQTGTLLTFLPMIAIFVVFYFLLIRPQQKRSKETRAMLDALQKGDEVITAGGIVVVSLIPVATTFLKERRASKR